MELQIGTESIYYTQQSYEMFCIMKENGQDQCLQWSEEKVQYLEDKMVRKVDN